MDQPSTRLGILNVDPALARRCLGRRTWAPARDPGFATISGGVTAFGWRDAGRTSLFLSAGLHRLLGDERLFLFPTRRRESLIQASGGATLRRFTVHGFAPLLRVCWERNTSSMGLYDYRRLMGDVGITWTL